jgi:two-component system response regulator HydG
MVAINSGPLVHVGDLPSSIQNFLAVRKGPALAFAASVSTAGPSYAGATLELPHSACLPVIPLIEMERRAILQALEYTKGDRGVAAHLLGIGRTTLYRKLKEYQVAC